MKRERFLIAVLWIVAMLLVATWFFDAMFGFNVLGGDHWRYLSELQLSGQVDKNFYMAAAAFAVIGLAGLYVLIVPWRRMRRIAKSDFGAAGSMMAGTGASGVRPFGVNPPPDVPSDPEPAPVEFSRPPKLNLNSVFIPTKREEIAYQENNFPSDNLPGAVRSAAPERGAPPAQSAAPGMASAVRDMLAGAGFKLRDAPSVAGIRPDFWAIGTDEALVVGILSDKTGEITAAEGGDSMWRANGAAFKSPVWRMTGIVQKLSALFMEVLEPELKVNILPFVFSEGSISNRDSVRNIWDALGVKVFDDLADFGKFVGETRPRELDASEKDDFDAFSDFINTVSGYFNGSNT